MIVYSVVWSDQEYHVRFYTAGLKDTTIRQWVAAVFPGCLLQNDAFELRPTPTPRGNVGNGSRPTPLPLTMGGRPLIGTWSRLQRPGDEMPLLRGIT